MRTPTLRTLPALNDNYSPARPWVCTTRETHECAGPVVGAIGALPVCAAGAVAEAVAQERDRVRIERWVASPEGQRALAEEAAMERRHVR